MVMTEGEAVLVSCEERLFLLNTLNARDSDVPQDRIVRHEISVTPLSLVSLTGLQDPCG